MSDPLPILIVEDEAIISMELESRVVEMGYRLSGTAINAEQALESIARDRPAIVLMDINIAGDINGLELARQIRDSEGIPSIFITAYNDETSKRRAVEVEAAGFLSKPFSDHDLKAAIDTALGR